MKEFCPINYPYRNIHTQLLTIISGCQHSMLWYQYELSFNILLYSCQFWMDYLVHTLCEKALMKVVQFVILLLNLGRAYHKRTYMYIFSSGSILVWKNRWVYADTLMNSYWENLFGKLKELLHATDYPHNYYMHIQYIIWWSSDSQQQFKSFLRLYIIKCMQNMIEVISSLGVSGCTSTLVDLQQWLVKKAEWIYLHV